MELSSSSAVLWLCVPADVEVDSGVACWIGGVAVSGVGAVSGVSGGACVDGACAACCLERLRVARNFAWAFAPNVCDEA